MTGSAPSDDSRLDDPVEELARRAPLVLPILGAVLMFLLAFIAVTLA